MNYLLNLSKRVLY